MAFIGLEDSPSKSNISKAFSKLLTGGVFRFTFMSLVYEIIDLKQRKRGTEPCPSENPAIKNVNRDVLRDSP